MTEAEWLVCDDPMPMLKHISRRRNSGRASERKLTLFASACCRRIWNLIPTDLCRSAVEVGERYADGLVTDQERHTAWIAAFASAVEEGFVLDDPHQREMIGEGYIPGAVLATLGVVGTGRVDALQVASNAVGESALDANGVDFQDTEVYRQTQMTEESMQAHLVRDIFCNPFRPVRTSSAWRTTTVKQLATGIYNDRGFESLPIFADALEEAGCVSHDILNHFRQPGEHVRGCWPLDLVLGKE